jgi:hypothetical protein
MTDFRANPCVSTRRFWLLLSTAAFASLATSTLAFPTITNKAEVERLRMMLVDQAVTCTKAEVAWYLTDPADKTATARMFKITCSNGREYGIVSDVARGVSYIQPWEQFQANLPPLR